MKHKALFFSIAVVLLVLTTLDIYVLSNPQKFHFGPVIWARRLSTTPVDYFNVTNPDPYLLEALTNAGTGSNFGKDVFLGSWDNTNIDELIETHGTPNVQYNDSYYTVHTESADPVYMGFSGILLFGWIALALSFAITTLGHRSREQQN